MQSILFVTGTDTDIGKTWAATRLIQALRARGQSVQGMKPVASGCDDNGENGDALALRAASSDPSVDYGLINPFAFREAIAPEYAANRERREVTLAPIEDAFAQIRGNTDTFVIEGAGGWLSPINAQLDQSHIVQALKAEVVMVVGMRLGCVHQARATALSILASGATLKAWIANETEQGDPQFHENIAAIQRYVDAPLWLAAKRNEDDPQWDIR